jgi:glycosyltransferase involved in cell wall biosynthesis
MTEGAPASTLPPHRLSVVVPLYNEEDNITVLMESVHRALQEYHFPWELILVDDGSHDRTYELLLEEAKTYGPHVRVLGLQRNFGQTAAMQAGIDAARGDVIATMDGDLQNDPADIPRLVSRLLNDDLDLVAGWRRHRKDTLVLRKIPSRIANRLIGRLTGVRLHDYGCSLKVYRTSLIRTVRLYGEMHRFIPAWAATATRPDRIREEVVNHFPRERGSSKYGISRTFRVVLDLLAMFFFLRFSARPGHFFGVLGLVTGALGGIALGYLLVLKILGEDIGTRPLLITGVLLVLMSVQFISTGIQSEIITRIYYASREGKSYLLRHGTVGELAGDEGWKL